MTSACPPHLTPLGDTWQVSFVTLETFGGGEGVYALEYKECDHADIVLHRARNEIGQTGMDLLHMRCESFAIMCKTGKPSATSTNRPTRPATTLTSTALAAAAEAAAREAGPLSPAVAPSPSTASLSMLRRFNSSPATIFASPNGRGGSPPPPPSPNGTRAASACTRAHRTPNTCRFAGAHVYVRVRVHALCTQGVIGKGTLPSYHPLVHPSGLV